MNRLRIKEHVISVLRETYGARHSITGDYPEDVKAIAIVVSIVREQETVGRTTGRLSYNFVTNKEKTMYVTMLTMGITVYSPIDEEVSTICGEIQDSLRRYGRKYISKEHGVSSLHSISNISTPTMVADGKKKTWASTLNFNLTITEIIES